MSVPEENVVRDRPARTARDLEVCECGDYRWQHVSGVGRCVFDTHGGIEPCLVFRLSSAAIRPVGPRPDGSFKWLAFPCQARLEDGSLAEALRKILFLRPGGPCRNKLIEEMENIASEALSSAPLPPVEDGWREPESAPRDGTDFLAAFSKRVFINQWDTTYRTWIEPFTAWRPLPPPPSDRSGG